VPRGAVRDDRTGPTVGSFAAVDLILGAIEPQPRVDVVATDAESGAPVRVTTYAGTFTIGAGTDSSARGRGEFRFWVPDGLAHPAALATTAVAQAEVVPLGVAPVHEANDAAVLACGARLVADPADPAWVRVGIEVQLEVRNLVGTTEKITQLMQQMGRDPTEFPASHARFGYRVTTVVAHGT
jgi:hypothetical protein